MKLPDKLILASASARRVDFLTQAGLRFEVVPADVTEDENPYGNPIVMTLHNAQMKARVVAERYSNSLVLGADTTTALDGRVFNKPVSMEEAREFLRGFSGRTHRVYSAVCLVWLAGNLERSFIEHADVTFHPFDEKAIDAYYRTFDPLSRAGAYSVQNMGLDMLAGITGLRSVVIGLPIERVLRELEELNLLTTVRSE